MEQQTAERPQKVYANVAAAHGGVWELTLDMGYQRPGNPPGDPESAVRVVMAWPHVKALLSVLQTQVESYEQQVGPVPLPKPESDATEAPA